MDAYIRPEMKKVFPELDWIELPFSHPIYQQKFSFNNGLPKIHEHDAKAPQGFGLIHEERLVCFYTYECDLSDGWEDQAVHNNSQATRIEALQMGAQHATIRVYGEKVIPLNHESRSEKHYYNSCSCNWIILVSLAVKNNCRIRTYLSSTCFNWKANYAAAKKT